MKRLLMITVAVSLTGVPAYAKTSATEILDKVDDMYRGTSAHGVMTMKVQTENWSRELKMEFWSKGEKKSLVKILAPTKEKGTTTLRVDKNIWNYLPKVKRTIKVPASMMGGAWMGSHFTNNDLVTSSRMADDFTYEITFEGKRDGDHIVEVTCVPKPDAPVVWGKIVVVVNKALVPIRQEFFDEDGELARTMTFTDIKKLGKRTVPTRNRIIPADKPGEYTEMNFSDWTYDIDIPDSQFSLRALQR